MPNPELLDRAAGYMIALILAFFLLIELSKSQALVHYKIDAQRDSDYCQSKIDNKEYLNSRDCQSFIYKTIDDPTAVFTGGLFVFTIALAGATIKLFRVTKAGVIEQARLTRTSLEHAARSADAAVAAADAANRSAEAAELALTGTNRAFVALDPFIAYPVPEEGNIKQWGFRAVLKNVGKTPTRLMRTNYNFQNRILGADIAKEEIFDFNDDIGEIFLFPDKTCASRKFTVDVEICHLETMEQAKIYFWGWADYNDVFPNTPRHRTEFAVKIRVVGNPNERTCGFAYEALRFHNGVDDECDRKPADPD